MWGFLLLVPTGAKSNIPIAVVLVESIRNDPALRNVLNRHSEVDHQSSKNPMQRSTDPEIIIIMCHIYSITLTTKVTLKYPFIPAWLDKHLWGGVEQNLYTDIIKCLCINLYLSYYSLFIFFSNLPPWIMRQGHQVRLCVFCLQSARRLFRDEVVVYKSVTPGSGPEPRQWFIIRHGGQSKLINTLLHHNAWGGLRNVYTFKLNMSHFVLLVMFWMSVTLCFCSMSSIFGSLSILTHQAHIKPTYLSSTLPLWIAYRDTVCVLHPFSEWQSN